MKLLHHIWLTVYSKPEDKEEGIIQNMKKFLPFDLDNEKIKIEQTVVTSEDERKISILQIHLEKIRHISQFIDNLNLNLNDEQKQLLLRQKESRLDSKNHFLIRFDKDRLIKDNEFFITDCGNCYHIKMSVAAFPTTRENALKIIEQIFNKI
jgi:RNA binding exosome subunit